MAGDERTSFHERWAHLRFSIVGPLLASPPGKGELRAELTRLAGKWWQHPITGQPVRFGLSTIERWYYAARSGPNPVDALRRKRRSDSDRIVAVSERVAELIRQQHRQHPKWSYKLHLDNLTALVDDDPALGALPSYPTLRRFMVSEGLLKRPRRKGLSDRARQALEQREARQVRSYESEFVSGLWHLDFHHGSRKIMTSQAEWVRPILLGVLDDRSRLICHAQWYLHETAEVLIHGLVQAFLKRGLPRSLLTDNGAAMTAAETTQGLKRLSIVHKTTLPYSPHQNGKQEVFWNQVEGRLLAMLEGYQDLSLDLLNEATQAWVEMEYHQAVHSEIKQTPLARFLEGPSVSRESLGPDDLRLAFTARQSRVQRRSDGTVSVEGTRYEVPSRFRHLRRVYFRYATWDLTRVWLVDERTGVVLDRLFPLDKARNADGVRQPLDSAEAVTTCEESGDIAPLLRRLMADYAATGLPPAYIPKEEE